MEDFTKGGIVPGACYKPQENGEKVIPNSYQARRFKRLLEMINNNNSESKSFSVVKINN